MINRINKNLLLSLVLLMSAVLVFLAGCSSGTDKSPNGDDKGASPSSQAVQLSFGGAGTGSVGYTMAAGFAEAVNSLSSKVKLTAETTSGYVENWRLLGNGETELAFIGDFQIFEGMQGIGAYEGEKELAANNFGIAVAYEGNCYLNAGEDITRIEDLVGKTINLGPIGSNIAYLGECLLEAYGIKDDVNILRLNYDEGARAFVDGEVDAFMGGPAPYPCVVEAGAQKKINILPVDEEHIKIMQEYVPCILTTVPSNAYDWLEKDVPSVGYLTYIVANKDVPNEIIKEILSVSTSPKGIEYLKNNHMLWNIWDNKTYIEDMGAFQVKGFKLHPGALEFWEEQGVNIPDSIRP